MTLSATEAAFEGFRLVRRHPVALLFWALAYLAFFAVIFGLFGSGLISMMAASEAMRGMQPSPQELEQFGESYIGVFGLIGLFGLIVGAVLNTAVARAVVRPTSRSFGYMRLGSDELRVVVVSIVLAVVIGIGALFVFVVAGVLAGISGSVNTGLGILVGVVAYLAAIAGLVWISIRLSLAVPITVAERRIALFDSFALTKGKVLPLLGMTILAFIMSMLVGILASVVALPVTMMTGGIERLTALDGASTAEIIRTAGPAVIGFVVVNAISSALQLAVLYAPFSSAYLDLKGLPHEHQRSV